MLGDVKKKKNPYTIDTCKPIPNLVLFAYGLCKVVMLVFSVCRQGKLLELTGVNKA